MKIILLNGEERKVKKKKRSKNLKKNKGAYNKLKQMLVPNEMNLGKFRKYYHPILSSKEKEILLLHRINPWSIEGLKYVGDCRRNGVKLEDSFIQDKIIK